MILSASAAPSKKMKAKRSIERAISSFEPCFLLLYISSAAPRNQNHKNAPLGLPPFGGAPTLTNHSRKHRCHHMHVGVAPQPDMWKLHPGHVAMASRPDMCKCHHMRAGIAQQPDMWTCHHMLVGLPLPPAMRKRHPGMWKIHHMRAGMPPQPDVWKWHQLHAGRHRRLS